MTNETLSTIGELAEAAGVTSRTIRYYTAEGLLPPPDMRGRYALYGREHLLRLQLIARLKEAYLPLGEIKARMQHLSADQVAQLLAEYSQPPEPPGNAADYVAQVLAASNSSPSAGPQDLQRRAASESHRSGARMLAESAPGYGRAQEQAEDAALGLGSAAGLPIGFAAQAPPTPAAPARAGLLKRLVAQPRDTPPAPAADAEERWRRIQLAPGVELHLREPLPPWLREQVARLIARARELFGE